MTETLIVSNIILWLLVLGLAGIVAALARQIGVLHERIAPAGALMLRGGPKVGEALPAFQLQTLDGGGLALGGPDGEGKSTLLVFLSPDCPVCKHLLPVLKSSRLGEADWLRILLVGDGDREQQREFVTAQGLSQFPYVLSRDLGMALQVGKLPYVVLLDEQGVIRAKGLVNSREQLESLFEARERGVESIQDYLDRNFKQAV